MGTGSSIIAMLGGAMGRHTELADEKRKEEAANRQMLVNATLDYGSKNWDIMGPEERTRFLTGAAQVAGIKDPNLFNALLGMHDQMFKVVEQKTRPVEKQIPRTPQPVAPPMEGATPMPQRALAPPPPLPTTATVPEFGPVSTSYPTAIEARLAVQQQAEEQDIQRQISSARSSGVPEEDLRDLELSLRSKGRLIPLMGQRVAAQSRIEAAGMKQGGVLKPVPWHVYDDKNKKYRIANVVTDKQTGLSFEIDAEGRRIPFITGPFDRPFKDYGVDKFVTPQNELKYVDKNVVFPGVTPSGNRAMVTESVGEVRAPSKSSARPIQVKSSDSEGRATTKLLDPNTMEVIREFIAQPTGTERKDLNEYENSYKNILDIGKLYNDSYVGWMRGRIGGIKEWMPGSEKVFGEAGEVDPVEAEFRTQMAGLKNYMIKLITGAAVRKDEEPRILAQIPDVNTKPEVFRSRYQKTLENAARLINIIRNRYGAAPMPVQSPLAPSHKSAPNAGTKMTPEEEAAQFERNRGLRK